MSRALALFTFAALSAASHALSLNLVSAGSYTVDATNPNLVTQNETVYVSQIGALPALTSLIVASDLGPSPIVQTATYSGGSGTLVLKLAYDHTVVGDFGVSTDSGTWSVASGTGSYAGLSGMGSYAISYNADADQFSTTQVVGNVEAVPEPASLAALGAGAVALARRRRKG